MDIRLSIVLFFQAMLTLDQHASASIRACCHDSGRVQYMGCRYHVNFTPRVGRGSNTRGVSLSCSAEAGTRRRKPGQRMSVWPPRHVRRVILTLTAILVFIYLRRNGSDAGSWLAYTAASSHDAYQRAIGQLDPLSQRLLSRGDHVGRRDSPVYQHVPWLYVVAGEERERPP